MENQTPAPADPSVDSPVSDKALKFLDLIKAREAEFEKGWWKKAEKAYDIYAADGTKANDADENIPYNILYSNTEVLLPSLYSATPKADIRSRFRGKDIKPLTDMVGRFLTIAADTSAPGNDTLDGAMNDCVLSTLVPGMGYIRLRKKEDLAFPFTYESGHYKTLIWGKATRWAKVPWIAFKHPMHKDQLFKQFDISEEDQAGYTPSSESDDERDQCCVYELWDRASRKVYFLSEEWHSKELKVVDDPLGLIGFFPTPGPLLLTAKPGKLQPTPLYTYYRNQAEELNRVSVRLNKVLAAIRVRGAYNGLLGDDLAKIFAADQLDNELIPATDAALLAQSGGFEKHIWLVPIDRLISVAAELYKAREAIKQVIYEITGISDIIRGSSVASETATAQDLKNKWGTVRLRKMQTAVANYARDLFRMTVDAGASSLSPEQWKEITQVEFPLESEKALALQQLQHMQSLGQLPPPPVPGQPAPPPNPQVQKLQATLSQPSVESLLKEISSDIHRTFVINIQTSSTIDLDTAQDKTEVSEFMNAMGQLLAGLQPLGQFGASGLEAIKAILIAVTQRYKFGQDIGEVIAALQMPPPPPPEPPKGPPPPSPEEQAALKQEAELKLAKIAADRQVLAAKTDYELAKIAADKQKLSIEIDAAALRLQQQRARLLPTAPATPAAQ